MARYRQVKPLARLLAGWGWQRDPAAWTVRCRDGHGRRARMRVLLVTGEVMVMASGVGPWVLAPMDAGRLRAALRDALGCYGQVLESAQEPSPQRNPMPSPRKRVRLDSCPPPAHTEIYARLTKLIGQGHE